MRCSSRADLARFDRAFVSVFGDEFAPGGEHPLAELGAIERAALPRAGIASSQPRPETREPQLVPAAWSDVELLRDKDFAEFAPSEAAIARGMVAAIPHTDHLLAGSSLGSLEQLAAILEDQ